MPAVSIIVPIYKVETYLRECIDSVLRQTYQDYELILVDDGSPDNCGVICDEYAEKDDRIQVIHKKNGGLSDARNAGLDVAKGKYIYFLDSDDTIEPTLLHTVIPHMEAGVDLVCFSLYLLYANGKKEIRTKRLSGDFNLDTDELRRQFVVNILAKGKIGWDAWSRVYVREIIEKHGLRFVDNRKIFAEDLCFCLCYCAHVRKVKSIDEYLYNYRIREDSIMGVQRKTNHINQFNELGKAVYDYYQRFEEAKILVDSFYMIHAQIVTGEFVWKLWLSEEKPDIYRKEALSKINDWEFLRTQIKKQLQDKKSLKEIYSNRDTADYRYYMRFILGTPWKYIRIPCKIIRMFTGYYTD